MDVVVLPCQQALAPISTAGDAVTRMLDLWCKIRSFHRGGAEFAYEQ